jgi:hypothetical protein
MYGVFQRLNIEWLIATEFPIRALSPVGPPNKKATLVAFLCA